MGNALANCVPVSQVIRDAKEHAAGTKTETDAAVVTAENLMEHRMGFEPMNTVLQTAR